MPVPTVDLGDAQGTQAALRRGAVLLRVAGLAALHSAVIPHLPDCLPAGRSRAQNMHNRSKQSHQTPGFRTPKTRFFIDFLYVRVGSQSMMFHDLYVVFAFFPSR